MSKKWFIGRTKAKQYGSTDPIYLEDFKWDCNWYWAGGYVGNSNMHCHFDGCFLKTPDIRGHSLGDFVTPWSTKSDKSVVVSNGCSIWESVETFLDDVPEHISKNWWRIKDLFKQFYALRAAAEVFQHGGHCTSTGRKKHEINPDMAKAINEHIEKVIIREIQLIFDNKPPDVDQ